MEKPAGHFASRWNLDLMEQQYQRWTEDPSSVDEDWQNFFAGFSLGLERFVEEDESEGGSAPASSGNTPGRADQQRLDQLIYAYRDLGHTACPLDPLGLKPPEGHASLDPENLGFTDSDLQRRFATDEIAGMGSKADLSSIVEHLRQTYCGNIGVEYMHITDPERRNWVASAVESNRNQPQLTLEDKRRILIKLSQAVLLEKFIHTKFFGQKRFSLQGAEAMIPGLDALVELAGEHGAQEIVFGMAHRGRLNVLCNVLNKSYEQVFTEFEENWDPEQFEGNGDVKYHLGNSTDHITSKGRKVHLTLTANPSHLEAVNPVVLGRARAKQRQNGDTDARTSVIPVLIHGDAAMAGQGLVMETFQMSQLEGYRTGGTLHLVINNQIGFTTLPDDARSTRYCTDIAKMVEAPVFHVNGDDPEAIVHCVRMAVEYRQRFGADAVIDVVCYRRYGHNESDEPNYTQPTMYAVINKHPGVDELYQKVLLERGDLDESEVAGIATIMKNQLQDALDSVKVQKPGEAPRRSTFEGVWTGMSNQYDHAPVETGVPRDVLEQVGKALSTWPEDFRVHPKIKRLAEARGAVINENQPVDWALAELLSIGSLLVENTPVRLSGQDCRRGTFSQRHSYWYDTETRERYAPLNNIVNNQQKFCVYNSPLIEAGVVGFDYGYSLAEPSMLIIWEAQFGDFVNGAQIIIDQFITSSESKWGRVSGLVMMLPHGQEGAGPEHSSGRLERFLAACADDNIQVCYCSTAAQHFHVLRRQMHRSVRKPLILMTPKSHLRSKAASSSMDELVNGRFHEVLADSPVPLSEARRIVFCSGKVSHDLAERREKEGLEDVAIVRIEQLYPWPKEQLAALLGELRPRVQLVWCQEEPQNHGAWAFVEPFLRDTIGRAPTYVGRDPSPAPAPGSASVFRWEQEQLVAVALGISQQAKKRGRRRSTTA